MGSAQVPIISITRLAERLDKGIAGSRLPLTGSIEVTARCNLNCVHCYINLPLSDSQAKERELTCKELCRILDQIADEGCLWLLFTGGEPFARSDFLDIYLHAKKKGLLVTLFTSGTTLTPRIADFLADWKPVSMEISVYGSTQETYERITGVPGSYGRCMKGIDLLLERALPLKLKTPVMTLNRHELTAIKSYAENMGLDFRFDPILNVRMNGDPGPSEYRIPPCEVVELDLADDKRMKDWEKFCEKFWGPPSHPQYVYQCGAGVTTFHIDSYGQMSACLMARSPVFDLRLGDFKKGWNDFLPNILSRKWAQETPCKSCDLYALCGQCPAYAQLECGDEEKPVEYLCRIAKMRAVAFGTYQNV